MSASLEGALAAVRSAAEREGIAHGGPMGEFVGAIEALARGLDGRLGEVAADMRRVAEAGAHTWLRVLDGTQHFVFLIEDVPVRFYRGPADDPTARTLRRQEEEAKQLGLALGRAEADGLVFRLAVETDEAGAVTRVVFLALRGEEGAAECVWPVPLDSPATAQAGAEAVQLRLIGDEGGDGEPSVAIVGGDRTSRTCSRAKIKLWGIYKACLA